MSDNPKEISWLAPEFKYYQKSVNWYWMSFIVAIALFLLAIWQKNLLFAIFIVLAEITVVSWANRYPKNLEFKINKNGVAIGQEKVYAFQELAGFHIKSGPDDSHELVLRTKNRLIPYVHIFIFANDTPTIKKFLKEFLPEMDYEESLNDVISRKIRF